MDTNDTLKFLEKHSKSFIEKQSQLLELSEDEIREELASEFGTFSLDNVSKYVAHLRNYKIKIEDEEEQAKLEENRIHKALGRHIEPYLCPYHLETRVVGTHWGRNSWRCGKGGLSCYLRWKAEKIVGHSLEEAYRKYEAEKTTSITVTA